VQVEKEMKSLVWDEQMMARPGSLIQSMGGSAPVRVAKILSVWICIWISEENKCEVPAQKYIYRLWRTMKSAELTIKLIKL
jgi:hypothetical protein